MCGKLYTEGFNEYKIWDRAYRLQHSVNQNAVDTRSMQFGLVGGIGTALYNISKSRGNTLIDMRSILRKSSYGFILLYPIGTIIQAIINNMPSSSSSSSKK